jgi:hypothetical protein
MKVQCRKCGSEIESKHRHDFVSCSCGAIAIDGGSDYTRLIGNPSDFVKYPDEHPKRVGVLTYADDAPAASLSPAPDKANLDRLHTERMDLLAMMVQELRAENERLRAALVAIDRHRVGAHDSDFGDIELCSECGEMRDIAAAALRATTAGEGRDG